MSFDIYTITNGRYFHANDWSMQVLRSAMEQAGVHLRTIRPRKYGYDSVNREFRGERASTLMTCFSYPDGWLVAPDECMRIGRLLQRFDGIGKKYRMLDLEAIMERSKERSFHDYDRAPLYAYKHYSEDDLDFIQEFSDYCLKAVNLGGFCIY